MLTKEQNKVRNWIAKKLESGTSKSDLTKVLMKRHGHTKKEVHADHPLLKSKMPKIVLVSVVSVLVVAALIFFLVTQVTGPLAGEARSIGLIDLDAPVEEEEEEEEQLPMADLLDEQRACLTDDFLSIFADRRGFKVRLHPSTGSNFNPPEGLWHNLDDQHLFNQDGYILGDYNGDGLDDIFSYPSYLLFTNNGNGFDEPVQVASLRYDFNVELRDREISNYFSGDIDGDGDDDLLAEMRERLFWTVYMSENLGDGEFGRPFILDRISLTGDEAIQNDPSLNDFVLDGVGDVDNDGDDDLILGETNLRAYGDSILRWHVLRPNTDQLMRNHEIEDWNLAAGDRQDRVLIGDYDGDGNADIAIGETISGHQITWDVALSNGEDGFNDPEEWINNLGGNSSQFFVGNFDGFDGDDLMYIEEEADPQRYNAGKSFFVAYSDEDSFENPQRWLDTNKLDNAFYFQGNTDSKFGQYLVGSFNGHDCPESTWEAYVAPRPGERCDFDPDDGLDALNGIYTWSYSLPFGEKDEYGHAAVPREHACCQNENQCARNGACFDEGLQDNDVCSGGNWYPCNRNRDNHITEIDGRDHICLDGEWESCSRNPAACSAFKITECERLTDPGYYVLDNNIVAPPGQQECIIINGNNIILDCRGHSITGDYDTLNANSVGGPAVNANAIQIRSSFGTSIQNCEISGFTHGISLGGWDQNIVDNYLHDLGLGITIDYSPVNIPHVGVSHNVFERIGEQLAAGGFSSNEGILLEGGGFHGEGRSSTQDTLVNNVFKDAELSFLGRSDDNTVIGNRACEIIPRQDETFLRSKFSCNDALGTVGYSNQFGEGENNGFCNDGFDDGEDICCREDQCLHNGRCLDEGIHDSGRSRKRILCDPAENPLGYDNLVYDARDYEDGTAIETSSGAQYFSTGRWWDNCFNDQSQCEFPEPVADDVSLCPGDAPHFGYEICDGVDNDCDGDIDEIEESPCAEVEEIVQGRFCARIYDYTICPDEIIEGEGAGVNFYPGNAEFDENVQVVNAEVVGTAYVQGDSGTVTVQGIPDLTVTLLEYLNQETASLAVKRTNTNQCIEAQCINAPTVRDLVLRQANSGDLRVDGTPGTEETELIYDWQKDGESVAILNMPFTKVVSEGVRLTGQLDYSHKPVQSAISNAQFVEDGDEDGNGAYRFTQPGHYVTIIDSIELSLQDKFTYAAAINPTGWGPSTNDDGTIKGYGRIVDKKKIVLFLHNVGGAYNGRSLVAALRIGGLLYYANTPENSIELNEWQHVAFSYDSEEGVKMFINGREQELTYFVWRGGAMNELEEFSDGIVDGHLLEFLRIGNNEGGNRGFQGMIDHVQIFNVPLSSQGLLFLRNGNFHRFAQEDIVGEHEWTVNVTPVSNSIDGNSVLSNTLSIDGEVVVEIELADTELECGMVIDEDEAEITLDGNLGSEDEPCEGDGITISGSDVTLNCDGNTIFGGEQGIGIRIKTNTLVENCIIDGFQTGISGSGVTGPTIRENTILKSGLRGIHFNSVDRGTITGNTVRNSGQDGIVVLQGVENEVTNNNVQHSPGIGIIVSNQDDTTVADNIGLANNIGFVVEETRLSGFNNNLFCRNTELDFRCLGDSRIKGNGNTIGLPTEPKIEECPNDSPRLGSHYETCVILEEGEECDPIQNLCGEGLLCGENNVCEEDVVARLDTDEDGVPDGEDNCPNTPRDENGNPGKVYTDQYPADWRGCLLGDLNHDTKICRGDHTSYVTSLDRFFGDQIPNNPELDMVLDGSFTRGDHTSYITNLKFFNHGGACAQQ